MHKASLSYIDRPRDRDRAGRSSKRFHSVTKGYMQQDSGEGAVEQLYKAVMLLASEVGQIEDRLARAYLKYIQPIDAGQLPTHAQPRLDGIRAELRKAYPINGASGNVDRNTAVSLAMDIILLYDSLKD